MADQDTGDFGWALAQMRAGHKVRRMIWTWDRDYKEWIEIKHGKIVDEDGMPTAFTNQAPLLAVDWVFAEEQG